MSTKDLNFWLGEEDLKTPKHDEMVLWTFNNAKEILEELNIMPNWKLSFTERLIKQDLYQIFDWENEENKERKKIKNLETIKYNFEQIDIYNKLKEQFENKEIDKFHSIHWNKTMEYPIKGYNGFNLGFIDLMVNPQIKVEHCSAEPIKGVGLVSHNYQDLFQYAFEIKPQVKSIGEVLRQFQFYKSNLPQGCALILVTRTTGLKEIFESQGFFVIEYKKEGENGNN